MYILFLTKGGGKVTREKYQELIEERIDEMQPGNVFITSDFADIAPTAATNMSLSRLKKQERFAESYVEYMTSLDSAYC